MSTQSVDLIQIKLLKELLLEFYQFQKEHYKHDSNILEFVEMDLEDPLRESRPEFHRNVLSLLDISEGFPKAHRNEKGQVIAIQLRPITEDDIQESPPQSYASAAKKTCAHQLPKKILLGCGNNPTSVCYHYPYERERYHQCCRDYSRKNHSDECIESHEDWADRIIIQKEREQEERRTFR